MTDEDLSRIADKPLFLFLACLRESERGEGDVIRLKIVADAVLNTASARKKIAGQARNDSSDDL